MVRGQVEKNMKKALIRFGENHSVAPSDVKVFIHTKSEELTPEYFYAVKGETVLEDGKLKKLDFNNDILNVKWDFLQREPMTSQFLSNYFKNVSISEKVDPENLYVMITADKINPNFLIVALYEGSEVLRKLDLEEIFGE